MENLKINSNEQKRPDVSTWQDAIQSNRQELEALKSNEMDPAFNRDKAIIDAQQEELRATEEKAPEAEAVRDGKDKTREEIMKVLDPPNPEFPEVGKSIDNLSQPEFSGALAEARATVQADFEMFSNPNLVLETESATVQDKQVIDSTTAQSFPPPKTYTPEELRRIQKARTDLVYEEKSEGRIYSVDEKGRVAFKINEELEDRPESRDVLGRAANEMYLETGKRRILEDISEDPAWDAYFKERYQEDGAVKVREDPVHGLGEALDTLKKEYFHTVEVSDTESKGQAIPPPPAPPLPSAPPPPPPENIEIAAQGSGTEESVERAGTTEEEMDTIGEETSKPETLQLSPEEEQLEKWKQALRDAIPDKEKCLKAETLLQEAFNIGKKRLALTLDEAGKRKFEEDEREQLWDIHTRAERVFPTKGFIREDLTEGDWINDAFNLGRRQRIAELETHVEKYLNQGSTQQLGEPSELPPPPVVEEGGREVELVDVPTPTESAEPVPVIVHEEQPLTTSETIEESKETEAAPVFDLVDNEAGGDSAEDHNESEDEPEAVEAAPTSEQMEAQEQALYEKFSKQFKIKPEEMQSIEGWNELNPGQKELVLSNFQQITLGRIQEEAAEENRKQTAVTGFLGKMWLNFSRQYQIAKLEKIQAEQLLSGGFKMHESVLKPLVAGLHEYGPEAAIDREGHVEVHAASREQLEESLGRTLSLEEQQSLLDFNRCADRFIDDGYQKSREYGIGKLYAQLTTKRRSKEYFNARDQVLKIVGEHAQEAGEQQALLQYMLTVDREAELNRFLTVHPKAEKALMRIKDEGIGRRVFMSVLKDRGVSAGIGGVARTGTILTLGALAAPGAVLGGIAVGGGAVGWINARRRAYEQLDTKARLARGGEVGVEKFEYTLKEPTIDQLIVRRKSGEIVGNIQTIEEATREQERRTKERTRERHERHYVKADALGKGIENLMKKLNEPDNTDREKTQKQLEYLIGYADEKFRNGLVDFGSSREVTNAKGERVLSFEDDVGQRIKTGRGEQVANQYKFIRTLGKGTVACSVEGFEAQEDKIGELIDDQKKDISDRDRREVRKQVWTGAGIGAGFALGGFFVRDAAAATGQHLFKGSGSAPELPEVHPMPSSKASPMREPGAFIPRAEQPPAGTFKKDISATPSRSLFQESTPTPHGGAASGAEERISAPTEELEAEQGQSPLAVTVPVEQKTDDAPLAIDSVEKTQQPLDQDLLDESRKGLQIPMQPQRETWQDVLQTDQKDIPGVNPLGGRTLPSRLDPLTTFLRPRNIRTAQMAVSSQQATGQSVMPGVAQEPIVEDVFAHQVGESRADPRVSERYNLYKNRADAARYAAEKDILEGGSRMESPIQTDSGKIPTQSLQRGEAFWKDTNQQLEARSAGARPYPDEAVRAASRPRQFTDMIDSRGMRGKSDSVWRSTREIFKRDLEDDPDVGWKKTSYKGETVEKWAERQTANLMQRHPKEAEMNLVHNGDRVVLTKSADGKTLGLEVKVKEGGTLAEVVSKKGHRVTEGAGVRQGKTSNITETSPAKTSDVFKDVGRLSARPQQVNGEMSQWSLEGANKFERFDILSKNIKAPNPNFNIYDAERAGFDFSKDLSDYDTRALRFWQEHPQLFPSPIHAKGFFAEIVEHDSTRLDFIEKHGYGANWDRVNEAERIFRIGKETNLPFESIRNHAAYLRNLKDEKIQSSLLNIFSAKRPDALRGAVEHLFGPLNQKFGRIMPLVSNHGELILEMQVKGSTTSVEVIISKEGKIAVDGHGLNNWPSRTGWKSHPADLTTENIAVAAKFLNEESVAGPSKDELGNTGGG